MSQAVVKQRRQWAVMEQKSSHGKKEPLGSPGRQESLGDKAPSEIGKPCRPKPKRGKQKPVQRNADINEAEEEPQAKLEARPVQSVESIGARPRSSQREQHDELMISHLSVPAEDMRSQSTMSGELMMSQLSRMRRQCVGMAQSDGAAMHRDVHMEGWCVNKSDLHLLREQLCHALEVGNIVPTALDPFDPEDREIGPCVHTVVQQFIKPLTSCAGWQSWALMQHPEGLKCDLFVSHGWAEGIFEFIDSALNSWPEGAHAAYCCMLSNPQNLDISGMISSPADSPFAHALRASSFILVIPNHTGSIYNRVWCVYEIFLAYVLDKHIFVAIKPSDYVRRCLATYLACCLLGLSGSTALYLRFPSLEPEVGIILFLFAFATVFTKGHISLMFAPSERLRYINCALGFAGWLAGICGAMSATSPVQEVFTQVGVAIVYSYIGFALFAIGLGLEFDRACLNQLEQQRSLLQNGFTGRILDAKSSIPKDKDMIIAQVLQDHSVEEVDEAIALLLRAGVSTAQLRQARKHGVLINNQTRRIAVGIALIAATSGGPLAVACSLDVKIGVGERIAWLLSSSICLICCIMYARRFFRSTPDRQVWITLSLTRIVPLVGLPIICMFMAVLHPGSETAQVFVRFFLGGELFLFVVAALLVKRQETWGIGDIAASSRWGASMAQFICADNIESFRNCWRLLPSSKGPMNYEADSV